MILENAVIPASNVSVPYDEPYNFGHGPYALGPGSDRGASPKTVRVEEILSLKRLIFEGPRPRGNRPPGSRRRRGWIVRERVAAAGARIVSERVAAAPRVPRGSSAHLECSEIWTGCSKAP